MFKLFLMIACIILPASVFSPVLNGQELFRGETIDSGVTIGYGVAIGDVDGDGKPDILLADKKQFVWYQNPDWTRRVMVENLTENDNVCIAARDIDGDGKVEVAVGAQWNPADTENSGSVHYLIPRTDRTQLWEPIALPHEPVVHRMRWVKTGQGKFVLVVVPLHGRGNTDGNGLGVRLLAYHRPANPQSDPWELSLIDDQLHITHNFDVGHWNPESGDSGSETIAYLGKEGAMLIAWEKGDWQKRFVPVVEGGGEIRIGKLADHRQFLATVEPFHGDKLVVYEFADKKDLAVVNRTVINPDLAQGHALATGDFLDRGSDQVIVGWRDANTEGKVGIMIYWQVKPEDEPEDLNHEPGDWVGRWVDENQMACEDMQVADLDGDGDLDIVAAGRSTHNLKIYWNRND